MMKIIAARKKFLAKPMGNRPRGRPPLRWIDCVEKDINILKLNFAEREPFLPQLKRFKQKRSNGSTDCRKLMALLVVKERRLTHVFTHSLATRCRTTGSKVLNFGRISSSTIVAHLVQALAMLLLFRRTSNPGEDMDVYKWIVPLRHWGILNSRGYTSPLVRLMEGPFTPQSVLILNRGGTELN
ncbi:hypothetical protein TNCV_4156411 [Trichonephila clavipes]|nr:hypothetical protein TNCV_4156411 [Trichonephila clavipes]